MVLSRVRCIRAHRTLWFHHRWRRPRCWCTAWGSASWMTAPSSGSISCQLPRSFRRHRDTKHSLHCSSDCLSLTATSSTVCPRHARSSVPFIYQAYIMSISWSSHAAFVKRSRQPSVPGQWKRPGAIHLLALLCARLAVHLLAQLCLSPLSKLGSVCFQRGVHKGRFWSNKRTY